jgi:dienelactone hydrolase
MKLGAVAVVLALSLCGQVRAQVPVALTGTWSGAALTAATPRLFSLDLEVLGDSLSAHLTQPYSGFDRFPVALRYVAVPGTDGALVAGLFGDEMRLRVDLAEQTLRGVVTEGDSVTQTVFLQRVVSFPLPAVAEREFRVRSGRDTLAGSLLLPADAAFAAGPHPAVVMVTGRGYGTRLGLADVARLLARMGIAAVVWDGRGQGRSTGAAATVTSAERIADVRAVLDWARAQPEIDAAQVGLYGYSAGGWLAPLAADGRDDVAFLVTVVGPAEGLADQQAHTTTALMAASDSVYAEAEVAAAFAYQRDLVEMAQRGVPWEAFEAANAAARVARWAEHALIPEGPESPDLDYYRRMPGLEPGEALAHFGGPILALYGAADWVVSPEHNVPLMRSLTSGNADATVEVLEMGHALERPAAVVGEGAWPDRYRRLWTRVPEFYDTLLRWLDARTTTAAER